MKTLIITLILLSFIHSLSHAQSDVVVDTNTTASARIKFKENLITNTIEKNLSLPLNKENEKSWISAFWGVELILYRNPNIKKTIITALNEYSNRTDEFNRSALESAYTLYPTELKKELEAILNSTIVPKHFAMSFNYLQRIAPTYFNLKLFEKIAKKKFPDWRENPILFMLHTKLCYNKNNQLKPPLTDLFANNYGERKTIVFSLQRSNRDFPGLIIIRKPNGEFMRNENGSIFHISQLARSINNLPGYITNGNTPQGIFSIQGLGISENFFIGKTPNLQLVLPFEVSPKEYFHTHNTDSNWNEKHYKDFLPESWKNYLPFYEAYYAGKAGRDEIIAHGTTIDLDYYTGKEYYPHTPTLGCLCAFELWNPVNGKRTYSDQAILINAFIKLNSPNGYLAVVEIDDKKAAVTINEILPDILKAEEFLLNKQ